ncbi:MAG: ABC transporter ATP-binding protein [Oscillospiraceae bacterium]|nr:ABC transporter ATP-binding protein [Oscillospiraceae bacterium]
MKTLEKYIRPYWWFIIITMIIKLSGSITELMIPYLMEIILDDKVPEGNISQIYLFGGLMLLCAVMTMALNITANRMGAKSSGRITLAVRHDLFRKLEHLSARQMDELTTPSAVSRLTSDTYNINQMLTRFQRMGIRAPIMLIGGIGMMLSMDPVLALVLVALLPIIGVVVYFVTKKSIPLHVRQQEVLDDVVRTVQENITGIRVIKALSKTDYEKQRFKTVNEELSNAGLKAGIVTSITNPVATLVLNLGLTLAVLAGAYRINGGYSESGVVVAFLQYFTQILNAMLGITRIFVMCSKGIASANRVAEVLNEPEDLTQLPSGEIREKPAHIEFQNVSFSYTGVGKNIEHLSFRLEHGQTLGILGSTGSGKSTIINLLLRLYDPDEGTIFIDGQDIRTMDPDALRERFGTVFQNDFVTEGTIAHNIRFFRDLSDEDIARAAEDAQAAPFIAEKENGMDSEVMVRGNNLSGGQKQRLLIARALAAKPEILVLDDASSALDYQTDSRLRQALRKHYRDTTTVLIAQRVSSLRHADLILVLDDGKVIGAGNHSYLMETCEEYRIIANIQMGDGKEAI